MRPTRLPGIAIALKGRQADEGDQHRRDRCAVHGARPRRGPAPPGAVGRLDLMTLRPCLGCQALIQCGSYCGPCKYEVPVFTWAVAGQRMDTAAGTSLDEPRLALPGCGAFAAELEIHHRDPAMPRTTSFRNLIPLCRPCHARAGPGAAAAGGIDAPSLLEASRAWPKPKPHPRSSVRFESGRRNCSRGHHVPRTPRALHAGWRGGASLDRFSATGAAGDSRRTNG